MRLLFCDCLAHLIKAMVIKYDLWSFEIRVVAHRWYADWPDCKDKTYFWGLVFLRNKRGRDYFYLDWIYININRIEGHCIPVAANNTTEKWRLRETRLYCLSIILIRGSQSTGVGNEKIFVERKSFSSPLPHVGGRPRCHLLFLFLNPFTFHALCAALKYRVWVR